MKSASKRYAVCFLLLAALLLILFALNLFFGSIRVSAAEFLQIISGNSDNVTAASIINGIRLPRALAAALLGGALSVSGFLLQTFFNNPIAGPFVLGISSGAKMTVAFAMIIFLGAGKAMSSAALITAAFVGSMLSLSFGLLISVRVKKSSLLIVSGVMIGYICSAITDFAVTFASDSSIVNLHNWSMGSFSGIDSGDVKAVSAVVFTALTITFILSKQIGAYSLGEVYAQSMGLNIRLFRTVLILLSSILSAVVTAFAGPVSFVGIAVPHLVKSLFGTAKPQVIIPASFLGGAAFCLFSDLVARTVFAPSELSISTVTAVFGAPTVIWIMLRRKSER